MGPVLQPEKYWLSRRRVRSTMAAADRRPVFAEGALDGAFGRLAPGRQYDPSFDYGTCLSESEHTPRRATCVAYSLA